ncbi:MAG: DUF1256 domain-containing protein [Clostridia bacterium]|nr:DUF1256 domain-containing protein [Clostridia bacterium]
MTARQRCEQKDDGGDIIPKDLVVVCFGTPLISGDAFAPLVADTLREECNFPCFVYGTTDRSVNGKNMDKWLDFILTVHKGCMILAIDASLGDKVGSLLIRDDGVCPAAIKGRKKRIGDVGLLGIVAKNNDDPMLNLMGVNFEFVQNMALDAAKVIAGAMSFAAS